MNNQKKIKHVALVVLISLVLFLASNVVSRKSTVVYQEGVNSGYASFRLDEAGFPFNFVEQREYATTYSTDYNLGLLSLNILFWFGASIFIVYIVGKLRNENSRN